MAFLSEVWLVEKKRQPHVADGLMCFNTLTSHAMLCIGTKPAVPTSDLASPALSPKLFISQIRPNNDVGKNLFL